MYHGSTLQELYAAKERPERTIAILQQFQQAEPASSPRLERMQQAERQPVTERTKQWGRNAKTRSFCGISSPRIV